MKAWEKNIRQVVPYVPGEQPQRKVIKLNTNENPYPPAPGVKKASKDIDTDNLRLYPDPNCTNLCTKIASNYGLEKDNVFVGVGSDDVLSIAFMTFLNSKKPILFPDITYSFYSVWADLYKIPYEEVPVDKEFKIQSKDYYKENGGVIFANPNAPTAIYEPLEFVEDILKHNQDVIVIVDEAYIDFGGVSARNLIDKYENLLVVQTFSKSRSMAGIRIGYAMGNKVLIKALEDVKFSINSYTMNLHSLNIGIEAINDSIYFENTCSKIICTREKTKKRLEELGFNCTDSKTNFLFVTHTVYKANEIFKALKEKDIFVRYFNLAGIDNYLRITIGTDKEMDALILALQAILK